MDKWKSRVRAWLKKENMIVLALAGILLMVIALPVEESAEEGRERGEPGAVETEETVAEEGTQEERLERKLEDFLSCLDGAGEVKAMVTFSSSPERVVEKDGQDGQENTVFTGDGNGDQVPYVKKTLAAGIEGVTILAKGGDSPVIQKKITEMIEVLFGIEAHKIRVAKMK